MASSELQGKDQVQESIEKKKQRYEYLKMLPYNISTSAGASLY